MPTVTEPFIAWTTSGEAETQERENNGSWLTSRVKKGSMFLTAAGAPYDFRYRTLTPEPYEEEFSPGRLAAHAGMSEFHFNRLFKRATGVPPSQYQIKLRIDTARQLLRETKKSVITIANDVGYSNPSHFAQLFRKETGLSPTDYRRQQ